MAKDFINHTCVMQPPRGVSGVVNTGRFGEGGDFREDIDSMS